MTSQFLTHRNIGTFPSLPNAASKVFADESDITKDIGSIHIIYNISDNFSVARFNASFAVSRLAAAIFNIVTTSLLGFPLPGTSSMYLASPYVLPALTFRMGLLESPGSLSLTPSYPIFSCDRLSLCLSDL
jgi:hypothetical protein